MLAAIEAQATHLITGDVRRFGPVFRQENPEYSDPYAVRVFRMRRRHHRDRA